jgi:hypothetical protein
MLLPADAGLDALPALVLTPDEVGAASRGQFIRPHAPLPAADGGPIRLRDEDGRLVGIGVVRGGRLVPEKVLVDAPAAGPRPDAPEHRRPPISLDDLDAAEADPPLGVDPDPASPDDV